MGIGRAAAVVGAGVLLAAGAGFGAGGTLAVDSLSAKFGPPPPGIETFAASSIGRLRMAATFPAPPSLPAFDPAVDTLRVTVGDVVVLDAPNYRGFPSVRYGRRGELVFREVRPYDERGSLLLRLDLAAGALRFDARGIDLGRLLGHGPSAVPVTLQVRDEVLTATLDMEVLPGDRWTYGPFGPPAR